MRDLLDRMGSRPVAYALRVVIWLVVLGLLLLAVGCASDRYLTVEEDNQMREVCGEARDCAVIHGEKWRFIEELLNQMRGI